MAKVASVQVTSVRVPLDVVTSFSTRVVHDREYVLVKVRSTEGAEGIGFCYAGNKAGALTRLAVEELHAPTLIGQDSCRVEGIWQDLYQDAILHGRTGSVMRALSIIDVALWDLNARLAGLPLAKYLGCCRLVRVPCYASGGYYVEGKTPKHLAEELQGYIEAGFKAVKIKAGRLSPKEEEARVRASREAIGPDVPLMIDLNNAWRDLPTALLYVRRFEDYAPYWLEEPFGPDDIDNHARLVRSTRIPIATGEIEAGRWRFKDLLEKGAADILQTDANVCGGITEWRRIAALAASFGTVVNPHWFHDLHVHLVAATPNTLFVEYFPDDQVLNFGRLIDRQLEMEDGDLLLPQGAGLGFNFDEEAVARYALSSQPIWTTIQ